MPLRVCYKCSQAKHRRSSTSVQTSHWTLAGTLNPGSSLPRALAVSPSAAARCRAQLAATLMICNQPTLIPHQTAKQCCRNRQTHNCTLIIHSIKFSQADYCIVRQAWRAQHTTAKPSIHTSISRSRTQRSQSHTHVASQHVHHAPVRR